MPEPLDLDALRRSDMWACLEVAGEMGAIGVFDALIAELEATRADRDAHHALSLEYRENAANQMARAERADAELAELRTFLDDDSDDWINEHNALKAAIARVEALIDTRMHIRDLEFERALRGDRA